MAQFPETQDHIRVGRLQPFVRAYADALVPLMRVRPTSRDEAAALLGAGEASAGEARADADATIDGLIHAGFAVETDGRLEFIAPETVIGELAAAQLEHEQRVLGDLVDLISGLPELSRAWQLGAAPAGQEIQGEITQGADTAMHRWFEIASRVPPGTPSAVLPDMGWIHEHVIPMIGNLQEALGAGGYEIRYLFHHSALDRAEDREALDALVGIGIRVRLAPRLPSWFYVDQRVMTALPTTWGADSPVGMAMIYATPVVHAMHTLFESLWATGVPYPQTSDGWQSVLELLSEGKTDEHVAEILGIGVRTVRRRIADAMDAYGTTSRFELGAAWAAGRA
ncbi:helix-turn-helix transcriptional regulator [Microbacterium sp. No. 7]|uniref:helix-turn-helix transcriptional regulator n=1 Tax=Microbacterium sp. No. 7 TaxID=1714373 RepID=UPI0006D132A4|nr:helix-turn-helix transcriptional regulator [Microbacterium sp. No. 7]